MIFKGIKASAVKKAIEQNLKKSSKPLINYPTSVGFIVDIDHFSNTNELFSLAQDLNIKAKHVEIISYSRTIKVGENYSGKMLNDKQVGWKGEFKSEAVSNFVNKSFDMLINYFQEEVETMVLVSAQSNACLRVGFPEIDDRLNDFTIATSLQNIELFGNELKKYLDIIYQKA
ncbi:hypothetical protein GCM10009117_07870 [Gangjinia marincola]|uniref:Uncharacterized protein n=1 Tax=Gangjinia marincola TaxID=578463 RepID=A0ABP3XUH4_9FLAO